MRVLITAAPFHGHLNAVLPLARAAHRAGHDVVVATGGDLATGLAQRGLTAWPVGPTNVESGMPASLAHFWRTGAERAADLLPRVEAWRPDIVIAEEMELGGPVIAARSGTPLVVHGLGSRRPATRQRSPRDWKSSASRGTSPSWRGATSRHRTSRSARRL